MIERLRRAPVLTMMWVLVSIGFARTPPANAAERIDYFSAGFSDYYVGVLFRGGKYRDAAVLALDLLDEGGVVKDAGCEAAMTRVFLVMQIAQRLGRIEPIAGLIGAQVVALRLWVRGPEPILLTSPGSVVAETAVALSEATPQTRVMGWTKVNLGFADPVPLRETPVTEYVAQVPVATIRETLAAYAIQPTTTYAPPRERPPRPKSVAEDDDLSPAPAKARPRKSRPAVKSAASASPEPTVSSAVNEHWVERAFGQ